MSVKYTYALSVFTSGLDVDRFIFDIRDSAIVTALDFIAVTDPDVDVWFKAALSGGDQTLLTGIVAAHNGQPLPDAQLTVFINEQSDRTITGTQTWNRSQGGVFIPPSGNAFPVAPVVAEMFWRADEARLYRWSGTVWEVTASDGLVSSVFGRVGAVTAQSGDYTATQTTFTPNGDIAATNTQTAIVEVRDDTDTKLSGKVGTARQVISGNGLTGGGDLSADRTLTVVANVDGSIVANANDIQVGVLASDAQHGTRGGGTIHAAATISVAGFMSGADKTKLDGIAAGAQVNTVTSVFGRTGVVVAVSGDYTATQTTFTASGNIAATNVQAAIVEVRDESVQDGDAAGGQLGGTYPNPDVRGLRETSGPTSLTIGTIADGEFLKRVGVTLVSAVPPTAPVSSVFGRTGAVIATAGDYTASQVTFTPNGDIAAATTQAAIVEVRDDTDTKLSSKAATSTTITAGAGLTGGGDLSANRTLNVVANADVSIVVNADDIQVGVLATDAQHGTRGGGTIHAVATTSVSGFMSGADKTKLDGVASGATNTPLASTAPENVTKSAAVVGVSTTAARSDHKHDVTTGTPNTVTFGTASEGAATSLARSDHTHALTSPGAPANVTKAAAAAGTSANVAREDHKHDVTTASASANQPGTASAEGVAASLARSDHTHALHAYGNTASTICEGNDSRLSDDRTASGLRSASTVVSVSAATAPTAGQVLTATSGTAANWQTPSGGGGSIYVKTAMAQVVANTTTLSTVFVDLLTINITAAGANFFIINASGAVSNLNANINMRLRVTVDGVSVGGAQLRSPATSIGGGFSIITTVAVAAGARVVKLQWATASATMQCRPVANPDAERACLIVQEVTA